jgi:hypothetical protein
MRALLYVACVAWITLPLIGCKPWPDATYRYKLAISVETPGGLMTASNVVELDYYKSWGGEPHRTYGQALVLDLGAGGTLVVLLTQERLETWGEDDPKYSILKKCGGDERSILGAIDVVHRIGACKAVYPLDMSELPDILLLKNAKDPASAVVVDPRDPSGALGPTIIIRSAIIQVTSESLTHGVDDHLPWVRSWWGKIDSPLLHSPEHIFNRVGHIDFIAEGEG